MEHPAFARDREALLGDDEACRALQNALAATPRLGSVIPGTRGVRKMRAASARQNKGKRGGIRILYAYIEARQEILLLNLYAKNEDENLSPRDLKNIADAARDEREEKS